MTRLLQVSFLLSIVGVGIGAYLVWVHYNIDALICGTGDCEIVQTSDYATVGGIPIAIFGTAMYLSILSLALVRMRLPQFEMPASMLALTITAAGTMYAGWLTWVEIYEIEAICQWCVASAIVTTLLFAIEIAIFWRLWSAPEDETADSSSV